MIRARVVPGLLAVAAACAIGAALAGSEADKPIIAELFADAARYDGRAITVYGLVIETAPLGRRFLLQDVSQMPLTVERTDGKLTLVGDQLLIEGEFHANGGAPYLRATAITPTKVLGGGGCC
jgi:hypothetical protein